MAHVGRFYKLQFRRDLANSGNNADGYPECFGLSLLPLAGTLGNAISGNLYKLVDLLKSNQPPMVWRNDNIVIGGRLLSFIAFATDTFEPVEVKWTIEINDAVSGLNLFRLKPTSAVGTLRFSVWDFASTVPDNQTSEIHAATLRVFAGLTGQGWSSYNP